MIPWENIDQSKIPGSQELITLQRRGEEYSIRTAGTELMNSRQHGSEDALATLTLDSITQVSNIQVLVGGLGMGYTLASALKISKPDASIVVSELIPAIVKWNKTHLGHLAGRPMDDPRVKIQICDIAKIISKSTAKWDAILLDVDNGPEGLTQKANDRLYSTVGLNKAFNALRAGGTLAIWSCDPNPKFTLRLKQCGFITKPHTVRARKSQKGSKHVIWIAQKKVSI